MLAIGDKVRLKESVAVRSRYPLGDLVGIVIEPKLDGGLVQHIQSGDVWGWSETELDLIKEED